MPYFICPKCTWRGNESSRTEGFSGRPKGCDRCGFPFLFELLEDFYPSPLAGLVLTDQKARIIGFGKGAGVVTGFDEEEMVGADLGEALELRPADGSDGELPHTTALEWGVRVLARQMTFRTASGKVVSVTADFLPAYDDDGGLLVVLTPRPV